MTSDSYKCSYVMAKQSDLLVDRFPFRKGIFQVIQTIDVKSSLFSLNLFDTRS